MTFVTHCLSELLKTHPRLVVAGGVDNSVREWLRQNARADHVICEDAGQALKHNAEILMLAGSATNALSGIKKCPALNYVLVEISPALLRPKCLLGLFSYIPRKKLSVAGIYRAGNSLWLALKVTSFKRAKDTPRLYMPAAWSMADLAKKIEARGCRYALLGDDLFLMTDEGRETVRTLLDEQVGTKPVDILSVSGETGRYLPAVANGILDRAQRNPSGWMAPSAMDAFLIRAYDILYLKGKVEELQALREPAQKLGLPPESVSSFENLATLMAARGWQPARDTLNMYGRKNPWVKAHFFRHEEKKLPAGLCVFLVREAAEKWQAVDAIQDELAGIGFRVLEKYRIPEEQRAPISHRIRGGNWGRGTWPAPGGLPAWALVLADPAPKSPGRLQKKSTPNIDNVRILHKHVLRDKLNAQHPASEQANCLHTSDNTAEALDYLETIFSGEHKEKLYGEFLRLSEAKG